MNKRKQKKRGPCWIETTRNKEDRRCLRHRICLDKEKERRERRDRVGQEQIDAICEAESSWCLRSYGNHGDIETLAFSWSLLRFPFSHFCFFFFVSLTFLCISFVIFSIFIDFNYYLSHMEKFSFNSFWPQVNGWQWFGNGWSIWNQNHHELTCIS